MASPSPSSPASPMPMFSALLAGSVSPNWGTSRSSPLGTSKGVWSEEEHGRFLDALKLYPQGPWKAITAHIGTRSIRQVQTHAQKYMEKVQRRARGLKTAHPRLVRRDHKIDDEVEPWWKRETGMLVGSPSRVNPTSRRRRLQQHHQRQDSDDTTTSVSSGSSVTPCDVQVHGDDEEAIEEDDELEFEPLPLCEELVPVSPLPTLEECLEVVNECLLLDPFMALQLEHSGTVV